MRAAVPRHAEQRRRAPSPAFCRSRAVSNSGTTRSGVATRAAFCSSSTASTSDARARHRDHVGAERPGGHARDHPERVEHVAHLRRRLEVGGNERPAAGRARGPRNSRRAGSSHSRVAIRARAPTVIAASASVCRAASWRMSSARQRQAERRHAAQQIGQPAARRSALSGRLERSMAEPRAPRSNSRGVEIHLGRRARRPRPTAATPRSSRASPACARARRAAARGTARARHRRGAASSGLARLRATARRAARRSPSRYRSAAAHRDSRQARARHLRRDVRVAVAVAADPRAEAHRRGIDRQPPASARAQRAVHARAEARQRVPQALLEHDEAAAHLVERRRALLRALRSSAQAASISRRSASTSVFALGQRQVGPVACVASAAAMRLCFCTSVRRATSVGCAVSTSSIRSAQTASCSRSGVMPPASRRANAVLARSALRPRLAVALIRAAAADRGDAAPRCSPGAGTARRRARLAARRRAACARARRRAR